MRNASEMKYELMPNQGLTPQERRFLEFRQEQQAEILKETEDQKEQERIRQEMENRQYEINNGR
jgi:hypothetical protein